jgi:hypothetical protein
MNILMRLMLCGAVVMLGNVYFCMSSKTVQANQEILKLDDVKKLRLPVYAKIPINGWAVLSRDPIGGSSVVTPLICAVRADGDDPAMVNQLLEYPTIDPSARRQDMLDGDTALHQAVRWKKYKRAEALLAWDKKHNAGLTGILNGIGKVSSDPSTSRTPLGLAQYLKKEAADAHDQDEVAAMEKMEALLKEHVSAAERIKGWGRGIQRFFKKTTERKKEIKKVQEKEGLLESGRKKSQPAGSSYYGLEELEE